MLFIELKWNTVSQRSFGQKFFLVCPIWLPVFFLFSIINQSWVQESMALAPLPYIIGPKCSTARPQLSLWTKVVKDRQKKNILISFSFFTSNVQRQTQRCQPSGKLNRRNIYLTQSLSHSISFFLSIFFSLSLSLYLTSLLYSSLFISVFFHPSYKKNQISFVWAR